jgi:hypothetical protein
MASLKFISMVNPPVSSSNPKDYVQQWLGQGHWDANYMACTAPTARCFERNIAHNEKAYLD